MACADWVIEAYVLFHKVLLRTTTNELLLQIGAGVESEIIRYEGEVSPQHWVEYLTLNREDACASSRRPPADAEASTVQVLAQTLSDATGADGGSTHGASAGTQPRAAAHVNAPACRSGRDALRSRTLSRRPLGSGTTGRGPLGRDPFRGDLLGRGRRS